jgi:hypothetical protein
MPRGRKKGFIVSEKTRLKMRLVKLGKPLTKEHIAKIVAKNTGKKRTPEQIEKLKKNNSHYWLGKKQSLETIEKRINKTKGKKRSEEFKKNQSNRISGDKNPMKNKEVLEKMRNSLLGNIPWNKGIKQTQTSGENNPNWKGGITPENLKSRASLEYKLWRKCCFERDNFTCQCCNDNNGGNLNAHHINNFSEFPELRVAIDNGITLCEKCHIKFHSIYGTKNNTIKQLQEFTDYYNA